MNFHHEPPSHEHVSRVDAPCLFHGTVGVCIGVLMQLVGLFQSGDRWLISLFLDPVFQGEMPHEVPVLWLVVVAAVFSYALAFFVLDIAGVTRRVMVGITVLVLVLAIQPALAVWGIYFSPFLPVVAVFWSWFFSMMYANHHLMPCDVVHVHHEEVRHHVAPEVTPEKKKEEPVLKSDSNEKYKPKSSNSKNGADNHVSKEMSDG